MLSYLSFGNGPQRVVVMHDFFSDISEYETIWPYLDIRSFTYVFVDLRGYGRSKEILGEYTVQEASVDVFALMDQLGWKTASVVGHSMSGMIAQYMAVIHPERVTKVVGVGPTPAGGWTVMDDETYTMVERAAKGEVELAVGLLTHITSGRNEPFLLRLESKALVRDFNRACARCVFKDVRENRLRRSGPRLHGPCSCADGGIRNSVAPARNGGKGFCSAVLAFCTGSAPQRKPLSDARDAAVFYY